MGTTKHYLCETHDIRKKKSRSFRLNNGLDIAVFHSKNGFYAVDNRCPHAGAALADAMLKKNVIMCIWHGWKFDLQTGECLTQPGEPVRTYPLQIENNQLFVLIDDDVANVADSAGRDVPPGKDCQ